MNFDKMAIFVNKKSGDRFLFHKEDFTIYLEDYDLTPQEAEVIPLEESTPDEFAEYLSNQLENYNYHSFVYMPENFLKVLKTKGFEEKEQLQALWAFGEALQEIL